VVVSKHNKVGDSYQDSVDNNVERERYAEMYKKWYNCQFTKIPQKKHTCLQCKANVIKSKLRAMRIDEWVIP